MDGDIFGDTLVDDLLALSGAGGDFDTSDLMDILEPDYLENNILLDNTGNLTSLGDVAALDDLGNFSEAPEPTADVHASFDAAVRANAQEENDALNANDNANDQLDASSQDDTPHAATTKAAASESPARSQTRTTPDLTTQQAQAATDEEDDTPEDPLEDVTSGMLPEDDLEALARLAAGEDEFPDDASDALGLSGSAADPLETTPLESGTTLDAAETMATNTDEGVPSSGKNLLDDTLDERSQPSMDELEELALLASGGTDLGSVLVDEEDEDDDADHADDSHRSQAQNTARSQAKPSADVAPSPRAEPQPSEPQPSEPQPSEPQRAEPQRAEPQRAEPERQTASQNYQDEQPSAHPEVRANQASADQNATPAVPSRRFSQVASTWSQSTPSSTISPTTPPARDATLATRAELVRNYRPPNQLRRYFNAGIMLEAADRLKDVLDIPEIPLVVFLGRAAERHLEHLPDHDNVTVAHLAGSGFVPSFQVPRQESFRRVLMAKDRAESDASHAAADDNQQGVLVADISDLELDDLSVALEGTHLLLTRLQTDPISQELTGTLTLVGNVDLRSGANFLRAIKEALESPITLMV